MRPSRRRKQEMMTRDDDQASTDGDKIGCGAKLWCPEVTPDVDISAPETPSVCTYVMRQLHVCDNSDKSNFMSNIQFDGGKGSSSRGSVHCVKAWRDCCSGSVQAKTAVGNLTIVKSGMPSGCKESISKVKSSVYPPVKIEPFGPLHENDNSGMQAIEDHSSAELDLGSVKLQTIGPSGEPHLVSVTSEGGAQVQITNIGCADLHVEPQLQVHDRPCSDSAEILDQLLMPPNTGDANPLGTPQALKLETSHALLPNEHHSSDNSDGADMMDETDVISREEADIMFREQEEDPMKELRVAQLKLGRVTGKLSVSSHERNCCVHCGPTSQVLTRMSNLMQVIYDRQDQIFKRFDKLDRDLAELRKVPTKFVPSPVMQEAPPSAPPRWANPQVWPCAVGVGICKSVMRLGAYKDECEFSQDQCVIPDSVVAMVEETSDGNIQVFASTLTIALYEGEELQGRAVDGSKQGKTPLSPRRLGAIRQKTFDIHSVPPSQQREKWLRCKNAINCKLRNLYRKS